MEILRQSYGRVPNVFRRTSEEKTTMPQNRSINSKFLKVSLIKMASTGTALFGSTASNPSKNLVEFRAGKMKLNGSTVTADKRKGLVYVYQGEDSLMHFCWKDRTTGTVEDVKYIKFTLFFMY